MTDPADRLQAAYDRVKDFPEKSPTGFMDLLALRNLVPEAILALQAADNARRAALEEAAQCCDDEADRCDDAVKWGGSRRYIQNCKAAAYAIRDRAYAIRALAKKP